MLPSKCSVVQVYPTAAEIVGVLHDFVLLSLHHWHCQFLQGVMGSVVPL